MTAIAIDDLAPELHRQSDGFWYAPRQSEISHPDQWQDWYRDVEDRSYWFAHRAGCIVDLMRRFPPDGAVFDVGGGNGHVSLAMQRAGISPVLVEPSLSAASNARERGIQTIVCSTLQDAGFRSASLPAVGLFDVLEHIEDDARFLSDVRRLLVERGRLYLTVPAYRWLWSAHDEHVGHFRRYTLNGLARLLSQCGFEIEYRSYLFAPLALPILLLRSLPHRLRRQRGASQARFQNEHACGGGILSKALGGMLSAERKLLGFGWRMPAGSSCIVVARKRAES